MTSLSLGVVRGCGKGETNVLNCFNVGYTSPSLGMGVASIIVTVFMFWEGERLSPFIFSAMLFLSSGILLSFRSTGLIALQF